MAIFAISSRNGSRAKKCAVPDRRRGELASIVRQCLFFMTAKKMHTPRTFFLANQKWRRASSLLSESLRKFYWFGLLGRGTPFSGLRAAFFSQRNLQPFLRMFVGARENCRFYFWLFSGRENCPLVDRSRFPEEWKAGKRGLKFPRGILVLKDGS